MHENYVTIEQTAKYYQVSISTVRSWIRQNIIPFLKVRGIYRIKLTDVDKAFADRAAENPEPVVQQVSVVVAQAQTPSIDPDADI
jgi:excisionase family DNA binding protein